MFSLMCVRTYVLIAYVVAANAPLESVQAAATAKWQGTEKLYYNYHY